MKVSVLSANASASKTHVTAPKKISYGTAGQKAHHKVGKEVNLFDGGPSQSTECIDRGGNKEEFIPSIAL